MEKILVHFGLLNTVAPRVGDVVTPRKDEQAVCIHAGADLYEPMWLYGRASLPADLDEIIGTFSDRLLAYTGD